VSSDILDAFHRAAGRLEPGDRLVERVLIGAADRPRPPARRRRLILLLAGAASLALVASAVSAARLGIVHLSDPARELVVPVATSLPIVMAAPEATSLYCEAPGRETEAGATGQDPVAICAALWRRGVVTGTKQEPPVLQACVGLGGGIAVYPGADACAANGRPVAAPYSPPDLKAIRLGNTLRAWAASLPGGCGSVRQAIAATNRVVEQQGLGDDGWRIGITPRARQRGDDGQQCVIPTVFGARRIVFLG
jgi:hypothetical protein